MKSKTKTTLFTFIFLSILFSIFALPTQAIVITNGTNVNYDCGGSCNVTYHFISNITMDSLTVYDNAVKFGDHNISLIPASGNINLTVISWTPTSNLFNIIGEDQTVTFSITNGNLFQIVYDHTRYDSSFIADSSSLQLYYTIAHSQEACEYNMTALHNILNKIGIIILVLVAGFVMFALVNGTIDDLYTLVTLVLTIAITALVISLFMSISFSGVC